MKRIMAVLLAVALITGMFAGCGKAPAQSSGGEKSYKIGLSMSERDQWLSGMEAAIVEAAKEKGCELVPFDAQAGVEKQMEHMQTFASGGYDLVILNLADTNTGEDMMNILGTDYPIVFVDRRPDDSLLKENLRCYVGAQEYLAGQYQSEWLAEYFKDKADKTLDVVIFKGRLGLENTEQRTLGAVETLEKAGFKVNKVFEDTANYDRATAVDKMATFLGTGAKFDCIISNNDEMALGAIEAMEMAGVNPALTPIVGIDGTEMAIEAIRNGKMAATAFQDPAEVGRVCFDQAYEMLTTSKMAVYKDVPFVLVDKANIDKYFPQ